MKRKLEFKKLFWMVSLFLIIFYLPVGVPRFNNAIIEALALAKWYAREHVLLCLIPSFFIAGAVAVFVSRESVVSYLGARANIILAYAVASVSGTILAVCSCTVLPLFSSIYRKGAGLGPAIAFLYSGPAINVMAIVLTARLLGFELGVARAIGAIIFSIVIGLLMQMIFKEDHQVVDESDESKKTDAKRSIGQNAIYFAVMVGILVFANWGKPEAAEGFWMYIYSVKWLATGFLAACLAVMLVAWFGLNWIKVGLASFPVIALAVLLPEQPMLAFSTAVVFLSLITSTDDGEAGDWFASSWKLAKQIMPLLLMGVLVAGVLLGRVGHQGLIPAAWVAKSVGGNSFTANFIASFAGAFMYFATLTEVPILQGLIGNGMGKGPALALLLGGPALSLPNMLVIRSVLGTKKTVVFVALVIVMATISGMIFGFFWG